MAGNGGGSRARTGVCIGVAPVPDAAWVAGADAIAFGRVRRIAGSAKHSVAVAVGCGVELAAVAERTGIARACELIRVRVRRGHRICCDTVHHGGGAFAAAVAGRRRLTGGPGKAGVARAVS